MGNSFADQGTQGTVSGIDSVPLTERSVMIGVGLALRKIRLDRGLNMAQMARQCGITQKSYKTIEYRPAWIGRIDTLQKIAKNLGISVHDLERMRKQMEIDGTAEIMREDMTRGKRSHVNG